MIKKLRVPHTLILLYGMIVLAWVLTMVLPAGQFETESGAHGYQVVVPGTFAVVADPEPLPVTSLFTVIPRGLGSAQGIIFFVLIIGGVLAVIRATGTLDAAMAGILNRFAGQPALLILIGMLAFTLGSSTIGMAEEYIPLVAVGAELSAIGMLSIQSILNLFIPSGTGQAYVTMPIMAPISDIVGVSRQVAVLAYQMGDGFMNMIVPTNPVLMAILGLCGIPYGRWFRFIWPLMIQLLVLGSITMVIAVMIGYQ